MMKDYIMASKAYGNICCLTSPHFKATFMGMSEFISNPCGWNSLQSSTLAMVLSLFHNLPHLCGPGGDAIILQRINGKIESINGTGKTGFYQNKAEYKNKGLLSIPRRGIYSTMVYGAPHAFKSFTNMNDINLESIVSKILKIDNGFINAPEIHLVLQKALTELSEFTKLSEWHDVLYQGAKINNSSLNTLSVIGKYGFEQFYTGDLASKTYTQINNLDNQLYKESDFTDFVPNKSEVRTFKFLNSKISCHGSNSPWRQLFLTLSVYEELRTADLNLPRESLCKIMGYIDNESYKMNTELSDNSSFRTVAKKIINLILSGEAEDKDIVNKQSHTIFLAGVTANGDLVGITNSIFTPLGALFEIDNTGILLSNRCFAFNETSQYQSFESNSPINHTNNCVIVESKDFDFIIGTSGGPVQSQTLAFIIDKVIGDNVHPNEAISIQRFANLGFHKKTGKVTYISETQENNESFTFTNGLSDKLGIVQIAGVDKINNLLFSCADPRGIGTSLGF
ncbi:hypothetical protein D6445_23580 [Salmonella enterica subsp. enterica serovar Infantis]|nr:hypothetical protein [Salmonella enterica subsp. enterica serovar Infantis]EGI5923926.1 hypothetical protein [Salmonella enterica subsp. enterica serovar Colindale]